MPVCAAELVRQPGRVTRPGREISELFGFEIVCFCLAFNKLAPKGSPQVMNVMGELRFDEAALAFERAWQLYGTPARL